MKIGTQLSQSEYHLLIGAPRDYPVQQEVEGRYAMPVLDPATIHNIPETFVAFDDRGRGGSADTTGVHFYKSDVKLIPILAQPLKFGNTLGQYKCLLTPDITLSQGMPEWMRAKNTFLSRAVGATWQRQGISVTPSLRWLSPEDYDLASSGVAQGSVFAVSSFGSQRDRVFRQEFKRGLRELVARINPPAIVVYGQAMGGLQDIVGPDVALHIFPSQTESHTTRTAGARDNERVTLF